MSSCTAIQPRETLAVKPRGIGLQPPEEQDCPRKVLHVEPQPAPLGLEGDVKEHLPVEMQPTPAGPKEDSQRSFEKVTNLTSLIY